MPNPAPVVLRDDEFQRQISTTVIPSPRPAEPAPAPSPTQVRSRSSPSYAQSPGDLAFDMRVELLKEVKNTMTLARRQIQEDMKVTQREIMKAVHTASSDSVEQHRSLIQSQEDSLNAMVEKFLSSASTPLSINKTMSIASTEAASPQRAVEPMSPPEKPAEQTEETDADNDTLLADTIQECGVSGRGATWIADTDRDRHFTTKVDLHAESGCCVTIVDSYLFNMASLVMICSNAVYLGIDADWNTASNLLDSHWMFQLCEQIFCTFFVVELAIRFGAFKYTRYVCKDAWFILDIFMVAMMVAETWVFPLVLFTLGSGSAPSTGPVGGIGRLLRLLRLARISKLMERFPELTTMVKSMVAGLRAVHAALLVMLLLVYVFAIVMNTLVGEEPLAANYFDTVRSSMVTLCVNGVLLDDISGVTRLLLEMQSITANVCFVFFILLSALTVMNMLIGTLCEVVSDTSTQEKENLAKVKMQKTLLVMLHELDEDKSGQLSKNEVVSLIRHPDAVKILNDIQVDTQYLLDISEMLFPDTESTLPISVFMNIVLTLRGRRIPTMNDLAKGHNLSMWAMETQLASHRKLMTKSLHESQVEASRMRNVILNAIVNPDSARVRLGSDSSN